MENKIEEFTEATTTKITTGKTIMGIAGLSKPTPVWVEWVFVTEFILNKLLLTILSTTELLTASQVKESLVWIVAFDYAIWQLGKFIGIKKPDIT